MLANQAAGVKNDEDKVRVGMVLTGFHNALMEVARVGTYGARKYTDNGWQSVPNGIERYSDAMLRHWLLEREVYDKESGLLHASHLAWNALARLELIIRKIQSAKVDHVER